MEVRVARGWGVVGYESDKLYVFFPSVPPTTLQYRHHPPSTRLNLLQCLVCRGVMRACWTHQLGQVPSRGAHLSQQRLRSKQHARTSTPSSPNPTLVTRRLQPTVDMSMAQNHSLKLSSHADCSRLYGCYANAHLLRTIPPPATQAKLRHRAAGV
jgi:hypothetical protein